MRRAHFLLLLITFIPMGCIAAEVRFNRDVRPILSDNCFVCHGPDAGKAKGNLRLDLRENALQPAESKEIPIVPGKPEASELIKRIFAEDGGELMPPPKSHKKLSPAQKETLKQWVAQGAQYENHWGWTKPTRPDVPKIDGPLAAWGKNPVDAFVAKRLVNEGLTPHHTGFDRPAAHVGRS
jgi:hypothetical protein